MYAAMDVMHKVGPHLVVANVGVIIQKHSFFSKGMYIIYLVNY